MLKKYKGDEKKAFQDGLKEGVKRSMMLFLYVLYWKWGFRRTRLSRFREYMQEMKECINTGHLKYKDIEETLESELGMPFRGDWW